MFIYYVIDVIFCSCKSSGVISCNWFLHENRELFNTCIWTASVCCMRLTREATSVRNYSTTGTLFYIGFSFLLIKHHGVKNITLLKSDIFLNKLIYDIKTSNLRDKKNRFFVSVYLNKINFIIVRLYPVKNESTIPL